MKTFPLRLLATAALLAAAISSCTKKTEETIYVTSPVQKGSAIGVAQLIDEYGARMRYSDGITVSVAGSSPAISAVTDSLGRYRLDSLTAGTYKLVFSKNGYSPYKLQVSIPTVSATAPYQISDYAYTSGYYTSPRSPLYQISSTQVTNLSVRVNANFDPNIFYDSLFSINGNTSLPSLGAKPRYVLIFVDTFPTVSTINYIYTTGTNMYDGYTNFKFLAVNNNSSFPTYLRGKRCYIRAVGAPYYANSYWDWEQAAYVYPGLNSTVSDVKSFMVP